MKLSIIIPIYNTQATLERCLQSILSQPFTDYELILIDDGSPDNCPILCDEYSLKDNRIKVIHKSNGGLSDARNAGIDIAQGDYITFIDSDDAIKENTLRLLMDDTVQHPDIDILEYPVLERIGRNTSPHLLTFTPKIYKDAATYWLEEKAFDHTYAWNKVFKRSLFKYIRFPIGKTFEDVWTIPRLIGLIPNDNNQKLHPKIKVTNIGQYLYYWNNDGITAKATYRDFMCLYQGHSKAMEYLLQSIRGRKKLLCSQQLQHFMVQTLNALLELYELSGKYELAPPIVEQTKWLSQKVPITPLKLKILLIFGYHRLCKLNRLIHKLYKRH